MKICEFFAFLVYNTQKDGNNMDKYMSFKTISIDASEVDYKKEYRLCHLFQEFSKIATINAKVIGLWTPEMMNKYGWVVAKQSLHIEKPISLRDVIELSTIAGNGKFASFPRYYFISKDNENIGSCSSVWTLIDMESRRIVSPRKLGLEIPFIDTDKTLSSPQNIHIDIPMDFIKTKQVCYSDVDTNQHMNNTRYIEWALDMVHFDIFKDFYISDLTIQYKKEIRPMSDVCLYLGQDNNRYIVEGRNEKEEVYFTIEFIFQER